MRMSRPRDRIAALQSQGMRDYQEDEFGILDDLNTASSEGEHTLLVVADGMGGHVAGANASSIVTESFIDTYQQAEGSIASRLKTALHYSNDCIAKATDGNQDMQGMGTTLLAAVVSECGLEWISVGDSPLWLYRGGTLKRVNDDHSMAPVLVEMVAAGRMTEEEAAVDPNRNALRSAVMGTKLNLVDYSSIPMMLQEKDLLLLASDGVMTLAETQIAGIIENNYENSNEEIVARIMSAVTDEQKPNQDNITLLIYSIDSNLSDQTTEASIQKSLEPS